MENRNVQQEAGLDALSDALQLSFKLLRYVMAAAFVAYFATGIYVVKQHEKAFVLNFGKVAGFGQHRVKGPGLHWTWPRPISEVVKVPSERVQTLVSNEFIYEMDAEGNPANVRGAAILEDGYSVSGDANIFHSEWELRYTISDPEQYAFKWEDAKHVLKYALHRAAIKVSSSIPIDDAIRKGIEGYRASVENTLRKSIEDMGLGVKIQGLDLTAVLPPHKVRDSFLQVITAENNKYEQITSAKAYLNTSKVEAQGEAERIVFEGESAKQQIISELQGDVNYFKKVLVKYIENPEVIRKTLLQDGLRRTLKQVDEKYIMDKDENELRIFLAPESKNRGGN